MFDLVVMLVGVGKNGGCLIVEFVVIGYVVDCSVGYSIDGWVVID